MAWFSNLKLTAKLMVAFGMVLVFVVLLSTFAYRTTTSNIESGRWVEHTHEVIEMAKEALAGLVDMETGYRGFLVTGNDEFLEPYKNGITHYQTNLRDLQKKTSDNLKQVGRWQNLERRAAAWQAEVTNPGMEIRRKISRGNATTDELIAFESSGLGKTHFDGMRAVFSEAIGEEQGLMKERLM